MNAGIEREKGIGLRGLFKMLIQPDPVEEDINEMDVDQELKTPSAHMKYLMKEYGIEPERSKTRKATKIKGTQINSKSQVKSIERKEVKEKDEDLEDRTL